MRKSAVEQARRGGALLAVAGMVVVGASIVSAVVTSSGCSTPQGAAPQAPPPVIVGVSLGLTNGLASTSVGLKNALDVAGGYINSSGGVLGREIQFQVVDDTSDATGVAAGIAQNFVNQNVVGYLGPVGSGQVLDVDQILFNAQIVQIVPAATSALLTAAQPTDGTRYLFRTTPDDDLQAEAVIKFALEGPGGLADGGAPTPCTQMAIVEMNNAYGTGMDAVIKQKFPGSGTIVQDIQVDTTVAASYQSQVAQIIAAKPQCLVLIAYDDVGDQFMSDLHNAEGQPNNLPAGFFVIGTDGIYTDAFIQNGRVDKADPNSTLFVEGVYGTNPDTNPPTSQYGDFKTMYTSYYPLSATGQDVASFASNMFDAAMLLALAIEQTGNTTDRPGIRDNLFKVSKDGQAFGPAQYTQAVQAIHNGVDIDYNGASGNCDLDNSGNTVSGYIIWKVQNGAYATVGRISPSVLQ